MPSGDESSLEARSISVRGGMSLDMGRMNGIVEIRPDDFVAKVQPGVTHERTDACVSISALPGALALERETVAGHGFDGAILGYVGDGDVEEVVGGIVRHALERGGTCIGEHGIEMLADPDGIPNPGKTLAEDGWPG